LVAKPFIKFYSGNMVNIALAIFLILFGVTMLVSTSIPGWVVGLAAVITGLIVGFVGLKKTPQ